MELERDYKRFFTKLSENMRKSLSNISEEMKKTNEYYIMKAETSDIVDGKYDGEKLKRKEIDLNFADLTNESEENLKLKQKKTGKICSTEWSKDHRRLAKREARFGKSISSDVLDSRSSSICSEVADDVINNGSENSDVSKKFLMEADKGSMNVGSKKEICSYERQHDFSLRMLLWLVNVAKDPTDSAIGMIPESSKWAFYGNENLWKQILIAREALFLKKDQFSSTEESGRRRQKVNPSMFEDHIEASNSNQPSFESSSMSTPHESYSNRARSRQRLEARRDLQPTASIYTNRPQQRIPVGRAFQADIPEWIGEATESDPKWLGTRVWPLEEREKTLLIERDPIGKGRPESCGCLYPGSTECVKFHIGHRRSKLKAELGSAFYAWKFDKMGEDCSVSWTIEEERKFSAVVKRPLARHECLWPQLCKVLPGKSWVQLVEYYFNVFVLRHRGCQNRCTPRIIDSDDDETEYRAATNCIEHEAESFFYFNYPSKKAHTIDSPSMNKQSFNSPSMEAETNIK